MAASRFPGKPLYQILGKPMLEHVYLRAKLYPHWDQLIVATCDKEIEDFCNSKNIPCIQTGNHHVRALDRVAEAYLKTNTLPNPEDLVICVQGDEPMLHPDMIKVVIDPLLDSKDIPATVLSIHIIEEEMWKNPDIVKIIHNNNGEILYTSRVPLPYAKNGFTPELMARRVAGIFGFRWKYLEIFTNHEETRLEKLEACDSNRVLDLNFRQYIAPYPGIKSYSVDSPIDIQYVEKYLVEDPLYQRYCHE
ncbi:MAG: NTP transferase domain-containing protein [Leptospiraceae bacterium]|nr:NTP transferase domain-containing protein [Leptospiraceae bacterium]